jgi:alpha-L-glutamate ligase-like protein
MSAPGRWRGWAWPSELHACGVLGINARNLDLLARLNPREHYPRVDDKLVTKRLCEARRIPTPETYAVVERFGEIHDLARTVKDRQEFVVKPARGSGGRGVLVVVRQDDGHFETVRGAVLSLADVQHHLSTTLSGLYSLGGRPDRAIVERRAKPHPAFDGLTVGGTPDIRIIVFRNVPVMAMLRLPTRASGGRANLHQGAVGAGVHLDTGTLHGGVCRGQTVRAHPDTGVPIAGHIVPCWSAALDMAASLSLVLEMGYIGVDLVLDVEAGPLVLEANARPGLGIQIANRCGLLSRLNGRDELLL